MKEELNIELYLKVCKVRRERGLPVDETCEKLAQKSVAKQLYNNVKHDEMLLTFFTEAGREELMQYIKQKYHEPKSVRN